MASDVEHFFMYLLPSLHPFQCTISSCSLSTFYLEWFGFFVCLLLLSFKRFFYVLDINLYQICSLQFFSQSAACLLIFLTVFLRANGFHFDKVQ